MKLRRFLSVVLTGLVLISCGDDKNEKTKSLTVEERLEEMAADYVKENPEFVGFYTQKEGDLSEIRYEDKKLFYIEYVFEENKYIENKKLELTFSFDSNNTPFLAYKPHTQLIRFNVLRGERYGTQLEAEQQNYPVYFGKKLKIKTVTATSELIEEGKTTSNYSAENLIDGTYKSWVEGESGSGIGTRITFEFEEPYFFRNYTNYACIYIQNGFGNLKYFHENNRVKEMNIWIDDSKTPVKVHLYDLHISQCIVLRDYIGDKMVNKIVFEILSVYPGTKYDDTCISEIKIGPCIEDNFESNYPMDPYLAELINAYYRDIEGSSSRVRINKGVLEVNNPGRHDVIPGWWPLNVIPTNHYQKEFDFAGDLPVYIQPGKVQNQEIRDQKMKEGFYEENDCPCLYKDLILYTYKNGSWKVSENKEIMAEINKVLDKHKGEYFTLYRNDSWGSIYSGVNDNENANYAYRDGIKNIELSFYKDMNELTNYQSFREKSLGKYTFVFDGTKYVILEN